MQMVQHPLQTLDELQQLVQKKIDGYCRYNGNNSLFEPVNYLIQLPGKRIRPALCLMSANLFSDELDSIVYPALALEVFHNFTLMHDDIMDKSPLRRGMPTVHEKWNTNAAILSGDAMMIQSYQLLIKTNAAYLPELLPLFSKTALEVCEGQQRDMDFENKIHVSAQDYLEMIRLKTSVLVACAMQIGGLLTGQAPSTQDQLYRIGLNLGLSFQLQDDYLDTFGEGAKVGKRIGGDILAHKKTYMMLRLHEQHQGTDLTIDQLYEQKISEEELITKVQSLYKVYGIDKEAKKLIHQYHQKALEELDAIAVDNHRKKALQQLLMQLIDRES
jgi:geranylgeranyl diphosphate synthase, type II